MRGILIAAVLAMCALAQSPLERAVTLARAKRYAEARAVLAGAAEPAGTAQRIAFHRLKAAVASGLGEPAQAADEMQMALKLAPEDQGLLLATAAAELQASRLDEALEHARAAGNSAVAQALTGDIREKRGEYVEAAKAYEAAVALAPGNEQYRIALALEFVQHYTFEPAIAVLEQAAPLFPKSGRIRTLLGVAWYALGRSDKAEEALLDAIATEPQLTPAYSYLAKIVLESPAAPSERAAAALCKSEGAVCGALKLRAAREKDDKREAAPAIAELKRAPAGDASAACELGRAYEWLEQWTDARAAMERCVRLDGTAQNHYRLGRVYARLGLADLARKEMALRGEAAEKASEEVAKRESAVQAFQVLGK